MTSSADYTELCRRVAEVLADEDVMNLADGHPDIVGEYAGEAAEIVRRMLAPAGLTGSRRRKDLPRILIEVFRRQFEVEMEPEEARSIACRIEGLDASLS